MLVRTNIFYEPKLLGNFSCLGQPNEFVKKYLPNRNQFHNYDIDSCNKVCYLTDWCQDFAYIKEGQYHGVCHLFGEGCKYLNNNSQTMYRKLDPVYFKDYYLELINLILSILAALFVVCWLKSFE